MGLLHRQTDTDTDKHLETSGCDEMKDDCVAWDSYTDRQTQTHRDTETQTDRYTQRHRHIETHADCRHIETCRLESCTGMGITITPR